MLSHARHCSGPLTNQRPLLGQLMRFGTVGGIGFLVDTAVLYTALGLGSGLYAGRVLSYLVAASGNWFLNRLWTFRDASPERPGRQWALFLVVNICGFVINYGVYAALVSSVAIVAAHPVLGVAAGALAGMTGNFFLNRSLVFRQDNRTDTTTL
ncbi:GtrA family protein [Pseudoroseomonas oryzae]|uniref:GtrA family protein n=2 Tax=Teichococcus oryzae TaxID=1608942 RepID=A0A5B2TKM6_9PROT|nr:GtrA family protein [Pseudoroseomonas oryzae]